MTEAPFSVPAPTLAFPVVTFVVAIWMVQLTVSPVWLRSFRFGPAEWLWRTLTYGRAQPMRQEAPALEPLAP
jgi:uncharacterized protein